MLKFIQSRLYLKDKIYIKIRSSNASFSSALCQCRVISPPSPLLTPLAGCTIPFRVFSWQPAMAVAGWAVPFGWLAGALSCFPTSRWHLLSQVPVRGYGSMWMLLMLGQPFCALSSGNSWRASSMLTHSPLILPSGWWYTLTVLGSGESRSEHVEMPCFLRETSATTNIYLKTHRVKDKYKLQQTFSVNPVYLRHANSGATTDFMVSFQEWAACGF